MASQLTVSLVAAATTTAVSLLGFVIQDQLARRSRLERRKRLLEDASRRVTFVTEWWKAMELVSAPPDELSEAKVRGLAWLNEASALVAEARPPTVTERPQPPVRRVLLTYRFEHRSAKVIRVCFYLALAWAILLAAELPFEHGSSYFASDFVSMAVLIFLAMLLRVWAAAVEKRRPSPIRNPTAPDSSS
ncbi:hypothetical protein BX265_7510 [Streptomyces sp. TLI_235]|nr:hypothetical protein [Streptomyces sp. TLI_235]PBC70121.1 hypothetical protein BX265_7510 [Streptomyces sp. TLI_235]